MIPRFRDTDFLGSRTPWLGFRPHCARLGHPDAASGLRKVRGSRRRLGFRRCRSNGKTEPAGLLGIHVNLPGMIPPEIAKALQCGDPPPATFRRRNRRVRTARASVRKESGVRTRDGNAATTFTAWQIHPSAWQLANRSPRRVRSAGSIVGFGQSGRTIHGHPPTTLHVTPCLTTSRSIG